MHRIFLSLFALSALLLLGAGCTLKLGGASQGGIFKTLDSGENWVPKQVIMVEGKKKSMGNDQITKLKIDARNGKRVFAGTVSNGLYVTEDAGETWNNVLTKVYVQDVALDSVSRCVVYVLTQGQLLKTTDCAKSWTVTYNETRPNTALTSVESDPLQPEIVYLTSSDGDVLKSLDRGTTWTAIYRLSNTSISDLVIDRWDSNLIYVATKDNGVFRSMNKGVSWEDVSIKNTEWFSHYPFRWIGPLSQKGGLLYVNSQGMYKSQSMGSSWESVPLLTPEGEAVILAVAVNPQDDDEIFYATQSTFYRTTDGGAHWVSRHLPSDRAAEVMLIDPYNIATVYLGTSVYKAASPFFR